jgi:hypothetical protein
MDVATWMRVRVHLCALQYRFERQAESCRRNVATREMWLPSDGYGRMLSIGDCDSCCCMCEVRACVLGIVACVNAVAACVNANGCAFTTWAVAGVGDLLGCVHGHGPTAVSRQSKGLVAEVPSNLARGLSGRQILGFWVLQLRVVASPGTQSTPEHKSNQIK